MEYRIFEHTINIENENVETYGIMLFANDYEVLRIYDVSTDYDMISAFVSKINSIKLDPFRLGEEIEKFLND